MELAPFGPDHLQGVLRLCEAEGWPSLPADPERAVRALTAPGAVTVVALDQGEVVGFAEAITDGEIQAYLTFVVVAEGARRRGLGGRLVREVFARSGAERLDLLTVEGVEGFYRSFSHRAIPGFRIYPGDGGPAG